MTAACWAGLRWDKIGDKLDTPHSSTTSFWKKPLFWIGLVLVVFSAITFGTYRFLQPQRGRTNIVVLGIGGENHAGQDLTDTMMFVSVDHQTGKIVTVSSPRDIWIAELRTKLNSVYHYEGQAGVKSQVSKIVGQPVDYFVLLDFGALTRVVDALGGVAVNVERAFDDYQYPIVGKENDLCDGDRELKCRYQQVHFDAGWQMMDGDTALKYVRSRYAQGEEGTDFAREARQQRLIAAIKTKMFSPYWLTHPQKAWEIFDIFKSNVQTDLPQNEYGEFFKVFWRAWRTKASVTNLPLGEDYLENPRTNLQKYDNQWVLIFKPGAEEEFQKKLGELLK